MPLHAAPGVHSAAPAPLLPEAAPAPLFALPLAPPLPFSALLALPPLPVALLPPLPALAAPPAFAAVPELPAPAPPALQPAVDGKDSVLVPPHAPRASARHTQIAVLLVATRPIEDLLSERKAQSRWCGLSNPHARRQRSRAALVKSLGRDRQVTPAGDSRSRVDDRGCRGGAVAQQRVIGRTPTSTLRRS